MASELDGTLPTASWVFDLARPRLGEYALSVLVALAGVACSVIPYLIIIDIVSALMSQTATAEWCMGRCIEMAVWWIARYALHAISTTLSHHATFNVLAHTRKRLLEKLASMPLGAVLDRASGTYKNVIVERVDSIETTLAHVVPEMTSNIVGAIVILILMFTIDWRMALASLVTVPLGLVAFALMMRNYEASFKRTVDSTKALNDTAVEYIGGIEVIKAFGQSKTSYAKFVDAAKEGANCFIEWMRASLFGQNTGMAIMPATLLGILPVGCVLTMQGSLDATTFISIIILSFGVIQPLITAFAFMDDIGQIGVIMGEVVSILGQPDMVRPEKAQALPADNSIELSDVCFGYRDKEVLHGVSMRIEPGTINALVGPSGSGKSTIARLIASLWDADSGSIQLGGVDLKTLPLKECSNRISFVSQDNYLFNLSVMDNIRMGRAGASDDEVIAAAQACGCHDFIVGLENGYETICGSSGSHLSGGERQRIAIARAMLKDAPIVILDEATSYTDPENEAVVQTALAKLIQGKTLLVIAHRISTVIDADRIFVVEDGDVVAQGTHEELLAQSPLYSKMWQAHMSVRDQEEAA